MTYTTVLWRCAVRVSGIGGTIPCGWSAYTEPGASAPECPRHSTGGMENLGEFGFDE